MERESAFESTKESLLRLEDKIKYCSKLIEVRSKAAMKLKKQMSTTKHTSNKNHQHHGSPIQPKTCWRYMASTTKEKNRYTRMISPST